ncbi:hypothetical protein D3OALGB2SA_4462 [Olavius algarvensis associated proteobacterium Delta 3]|nr:hypothetical protein D3OALGB2SA_4462 [Olavius algarvensis associated proteobacterium Delta 3]
MEIRHFHFYTDPVLILFFIALPVARNRSNLIHKIASAIL